MLAGGPYSVKGNYKLGDRQTFTMPFLPFAEELRTAVFCRAPVARRDWSRCYRNAAPVVIRSATQHPSSGGL